MSEEEKKEMVTIPRYARARSWAFIGGIEPKISLVFDEPGSPHAFIDVSDGMIALMASELTSYACGKVPKK